MTIFSRLLDRDDYVPALWDLAQDEAARDYSIEIFKLHFDDMLRILADHRGDEARRQARPARQAFFSFLDGLDAEALERHPHVHAWTVERERLLTRYGIEDPYRELKEQENAAALPLAETVLEELGRQAPLDARLRLAVAGIFAGNIFDLGSPAAARQHRSKGVSFRELREQVSGRPWLVDHSAGLVPLVERLAREEGKALLLVDNAGPDFVCGTLPFGWLLASLGARVVLAANATPTLNDVTVTEARDLLTRLAARLPTLDRQLEREQLRLVSTGTGTPGIDLTTVGEELELEGRDARLVLLEGQGRALETNWRARFDVDVLRIATIKDPLVAGLLGGSVFDLVLDVRQAGEGLSPKASHGRG